MKIKFLIVVFGVCISTVAAGQITPVKVKSDLLLQAIDIFIDTIALKPNHPGVVLIDYQNLNSDPYIVDQATGKISRTDLRFEIVVSLELNKSSLVLRPPSYMFTYRDRLILISTGFEQLVQRDKNADEKALKKIYKKLPQSGTYFPMPWIKVKCSGDKIDLIGGALPKIEN